MKNMNDKTKKWLTVAGCLVVCAVLVVLIGAQFQTKPITDDPLSSQSSEAGEVTVRSPTTEQENGVVVAPPEILKEQPSSDNGAVSSGTEQTIQPDVTKPTEPEKSVKTDPTQKPNGEKVSEPPTPVDHDKVEPPKEPPKQDSQPQGGDTQDGKIYVPGFGWIEDVGEGQGRFVDGDGDINKQVGTMGE